MTRVNKKKGPGPQALALGPLPGALGPTCFKAICFNILKNIALGALFHDLQYFEEYCLKAILFNIEKMFFNIFQYFAKS